MNISVKFEGSKELKRALNKGANATSYVLPKVLRKSAADLNRTMKRRAEFTKGYQTGTTKRSIGSVVSDNKAEVGARTEYAPYLEHGTRFMAAQPFVKPALDEVAPDFKRMLSELLEKEIK